MENYDCLGGLSSDDIEPKVDKITELSSVEGEDLPPLKQTPELALLPALCPKLKRLSRFDDRGADSLEAHQVKLQKELAGVLLKNPSCGRAQHLSDVRQRITLRYALWTFLMGMIFSVGVALLT